MGLILDLAVAAFALVVIGSLAALAWTLGVSAVRATERGRVRVAEARRTVADADASLPATITRADALVGQALARTTPSRSPGSATDTDTDSHTDTDTEPTEIRDS